jgi:hypothetical protein
MHVIFGFIEIFERHVYKERKRNMRGDPILQFLENLPLCIDIVFLFWVLLECVGNLCFNGMKLILGKKSIVSLPVSAKFKKIPIQKLY